VANGVVYVGGYDKNLFAFDAAGATGCSSTPKTCDPLWTGETGDLGGIAASPAVANGVVYIGTAANEDALLAFDAAGSTGCSGTPKICSSLWNAVAGGGFDSPAVANGFVYAGSDDGNLYAFTLPS
jgi:outer membrane protein assembly factor BamB